jgi:hypothetical protein
MNTSSYPSWFFPGACFQSSVHAASEPQAGSLPQAQACTEPRPAVAPAFRGVMTSSGVTVKIEQAWSTGMLRGYAQSARINCLKSRGMTQPEKCFCPHVSAAAKVHQYGCTFAEETECQLSQSCFYVAGARGRSDSHATQPQVF